VAVAAQSADKRRLTRGAGVSGASKSGSHNLKFNKKWRGGCGRAKRGQEAADPRSGCERSEQKRQSQFKI